MPRNRLTATALLLADPHAHQYARRERRRSGAAYAQELTTIYDELAQSFSPLLHELREAAKLAYAAQWLRARNAALKLPAEGRGSWNGSGTALA